MNITSHPNNIVLAMKLPFIANSALQMEKSAGIDRNDTSEVCVMWKLDLTNLYITKSSVKRTIIILQPGQSYSKMYGTEPR